MFVIICFGGLRVKYVNMLGAEIMSFITDMLNQEIREQKRTASGVHSRKGKRGYVGKMLFPVDLMSRKDKYNYRKAGKCIVTSIRDELLSRDKFKVLSIEDQVKTLSHWRGKYDTKAIVEALGISKGSYYQLSSDLGVTKQYSSRKAKAKTPKKKEALPVVPDAPEAVHSISKKDILEGLLLAYTGDYSAEDIIRKLDKIGLILSDEPNKFEVEIKIRELV